MSRELTRREVAALLGVGALGGLASADEGRPPVLPGVVGLGRAAARLGKPLSGEAAQRAVQDALAAAIGMASGESAAQRLFRPSDTVGIKVNCLAGPKMSPRVELVEAFVDLVAACGVDRRRIVVFERSSRELERAGFTVRQQAPPYVCVGTDNDYDDLPSSSGSIGSCYARLVSTTCSSLVSFGVVKDHDLAGVSAGMKNWYGVIHNPNKYHDSGCDPYVADVVHHPFIRDKLRLTVLDGVVAQCHGGPALRVDATFELGMVAASTDPVAIDLWALNVIDGERSRRGMPSLEQAGRFPRWLATAARQGLGVDDPAKLRLVSA